MEQGLLRCDVNLSPAALARRPAGHPHGDQERQLVPVRREVGALRGGTPGRDPLDGGTITQETRHWHEDTGITPGREVRREDYRYFPEPDLVPVAPPREWVDELRGTLPEPPREHRARLQAEWGFSDLEMRDTVGATRSRSWSRPWPPGPRCRPREWWLSDMARRANEQGVDLADLPVTPPTSRGVQALVDEGRINDKFARQVFDGVLAGEGRPSRRRRRLGTRGGSDDGAPSAAVDDAIAANPDVADKIRDGKVAAAGCPDRAVMKQMRGQADATGPRTSSSSSFG